jgi:predicted membrane protein
MVVEPTLNIFHYIIVAGLGALLGAAELISRYRDDPWKTVFTVPGFAYLSTNIITSLAALYVIAILQMDFGVKPELGLCQSEDTSCINTATIQTSKHILLYQILLASFGAAAFFRSSVFNIKAGDSSVSIGPAIIYDIIIAVIDRDVDRKRAQVRADVVDKLIKGLDYSEASGELPTLCFGLMQNVKEEEQKQVKLAVIALNNNEQDLSEYNQLMMLGLILIEITGPEVLEKAIDKLRHIIAKPPD